MGFERTITHLDEHLVDIGSKVSALISKLYFFFMAGYKICISYTSNIHPPQGITKPKEVRKFKGEGMPLHFSTKKGDLYVTFEVLFPTSLTEAQKTKIKEVLS